MKFSRNLHICSDTTGSVLISLLLKIVLKFYAISEALEKSLPEKSAAASIVISPENRAFIRSTVSPLITVDVI